MLYVQLVISHDEMEDIQSDRTPIVEMARRLVSVMETRSWAQCVKFAVLLQETEGIEDVGLKLLQSAGETNFDYIFQCYLYRPMYIRLCLALPSRLN